MRCLSTTTTRSCRRCTREATTLVVWHNGWAASCTQHADRTAMGHPESVFIDLLRDDRPCASCGKFPIAHAYDPTRVHPEPVDHAYTPGNPPSPDPDGECRLWMGWCFTHHEADTMDHHFAVYPDAYND